jgi:sensor histidine kinase YesM
MSVPEKQNPKNALKSILSYQWILKHIGFLLFLSFLAVLYIANGHFADSTVRKINQNKKKLKELQFEYKTAKAELMYRSEATQIENAMAPYGLVVAKTMPLRVQIEKHFKIDSAQ